MPTHINRSVRDPMVTDKTGQGGLYPAHDGMGDAVGRAVVKMRAETPAGTTAPDIVFTEVFAGPRAVLSARVARHLAVDRALSC